MPTEREIKTQRVRDYLSAKGLDAVVLTTQAGFAWYTCGGDNHVVTASEGGVASLVVTPERACVVTDTIEAPRIRDEEVPSDIEVIEHPWHKGARRAEKILAIIGHGRAGGDDGTAGLPLLDADFAELRFSLTDDEAARYRALGRDCSQVMTQVCRAIEPGWTENDIAGRLAAALWPRNIVPHVTLVGADERLRKYRHPICTQKPVETCVMVVLCGRRHGLICSLTRLVYFGTLAEELAAKHRAVCAVDAVFNLETRVGASVGDIFRAGCEAYAAQGCPDEWRLHHQGGPTGYAGRDYVGTPGESRTVQPMQAFAWNPSITGTKSEDTILALDDGIEILSPPLDWPTITVEHNGVALERAAILEK